MQGGHLFLQSPVRVHEGGEGVGSAEHLVKVEVVCMEDGVADEAAEEACKSPVLLV